MNFKGTTIETPPRRSWPRRLLNRLEVDRATFYALSVRVWQLIAGPVTLLLIGAHFPPEIQGWFYIFAELIALQSLAELSLHQVVINLASHEWSQLHLTDERAVDGDDESKARLAALLRFFARWYTGMGTVYLLAIGIGGGWWMLRGSDFTEIWILAPWAVATICTAVSLGLSPVYAILDGCNQVTATHRYRILQSVIGNVAVWVCILAGAGLWTVIAVTGVKLLGDVYPLLGPYRVFFLDLWRTPPSSEFAYTSDVAPLQWRLAIQTGTQSLAMASFTLVLFEYHGEQMAGRMGMTWTALKALQFAAIAWVVTRVPKLGMLIAQKDFADANRMLTRVLWVSFGMIVFGAVTAMGVVAGLHAWGHFLADRLIPWPAFCVMVLCVVLNHIPLSLSFYFRAHKKEPLVAWTAFANLAVVFAVWWGGQTAASAMGAAIGYLVVVAGLILPLSAVIWFRLRPKWQMAPSDSDQHE